MSAPVDIGQAPKLPPVRLRSVLLTGAIAASIGIFVFTFAYYVDHTRGTEARRAWATGYSALENCQQIEAVKGQVRLVLRAEGVPREVDRFKERDCYTLAAVKAVGIKPPKP